MIQVSSNNSTHLGVGMSGQRRHIHGVGPPTCTDDAYLYLLGHDLFPVTGTAQVCLELSRI
jgi:hypothetical protein